MKNADVEEYNTVRINQYLGDEYISVAQDCIVGKVSDSNRSRMLNNLKGKKTTELNGFPTELKLKIRIKYMVTIYINVEDGLVNGACRVLKKIVFNLNSPNPFKVFLDFGEENVGLQARNLQKTYMEAENIEPYLTLISLSRQVLSI